MLCTPQKHSVGMTRRDFENLCASLHVCRKVTVFTTVCIVRSSSTIFANGPFGPECSLVFPLLKFPCFFNIFLWYLKWLHPTIPHLTWSKDSNCLPGCGKHPGIILPGVEFSSSSASSSFSSQNCCRDDPGPGNLPLEGTWWCEKGRTNTYCLKLVVN